jgi:putative ABC transport system permease protein
MDDHRNKPPRIAEKTLRFLCLDRRADSLLGDFAEAYADIAGRHGPAAACFWYAGQVIRSIPGFLLTRFYWSAVMFRNYLVIYFRNLLRDRGISLINLAGLAAGMASFLLILTYVRFETGYDRFVPRSDRIFRLIGVTKDSGSGTSSPYLLAPALKAEVPGISRFTRIMHSNEKPVLQAGEKQFFEKGLFVDEGFLEIFPFAVLDGDPGTALSGPSKIVLTRSAARRFFGGGDPLGKTMTFRDLEKPRDLIVTAVLENIPADSHLKFDYLISMETLRPEEAYSYILSHWNVSNFPTYIELSEEVSPTDIKAGISAWMARLRAQGGRGKSGPYEDSYNLQPLRDIHLKSDFGFEYADTGDLRNVRLFMAVAVLVLIIAGINHVNLATARSGVRAREIGIRKVTGAFRGQIFRQFLGESLAVMILAGALALGLYALFLPGFASLVGAPLRLSLAGSGGVLPWLVVTVVVLAVGSGLYPAALLSRLAPVRTLREFAPAGGKGAGLRNLLVVSQFTASVVLVASTLVVLGQMRYIRSMRLGYNRQHVIVIPAQEQETQLLMPVIRTEMERRPEVVKASLTSGLPTDIGRHWYGWKAAKEDGTQIECDFQCDYVDASFLEVFEIGLAAGRNFRAGDKDAVILNETAVRDLGWKDPVGKKLKHGAEEYQVVGIVRDFHFASLHSKIGPMALVFGEGRNLAVRVRPGDLQMTMGVLRSVFERNAHGQPFDFFFLDDAFNALYRKEVRAGKLLGASAGLAVLIACLGLLGLTSFNVARRVREIGIRRVLGAPISSLVLLLNRDFIRLVIVANLLAWPLAYWAMNKWLEVFAYRIAVSPGVLLQASLLAVAISFLVVAGQTIRAALVNASETLRCE